MAVIDLHKQYLSKICAGLGALESRLGSPEADSIAAHLLATIRTRIDELPYDPLIEIALALHDAMAYKDSWRLYTPAQYRQAKGIFETLAINGSIAEETVEKSIMALEDIGFDTTPFSWEG